VFQVRQGAAEASDVIAELAKAEVAFSTQPPPELTRRMVVI